MKEGIIMTAGIVIIIVVVILAIIIAALYNGMVKARNLTDEAESQIGVQLKRRADLIPNLVNTVKGYAKHEHDTLMDAIQARGVANGQSQADPLSDLQKQADVMGDDRQPIAKRAQADSQATQVLGHLFAVSENYPNLKAAQNFSQLQEELTTTENRVAASRTNYNRTIRDYNNKIEVFPTNIFAGMFHFTKKEQLPIEESTKTAPEVKF
ncbi:LemA family protein [Lapidilactobacillus concavus DSM 17758]|uniref:LemA family protein n=2 Tax=Lapidilactobacillus TaxID=2767884 RepID=A0A0R1W7Q5_9LACO|nr:LemA family protein [Lapidilactobacillus concavus DSM 17758]